jgi:hypothetical protein
VVLVGLASGEESDPEESITGAVLGAYSIKEEIKNSNPCSNCLLLHNNLYKEMIWNKKISGKLM